MIRGWEYFTNCSAGLQLDLRNARSIEWSVCKAIWQSKQFLEYRLSSANRFFTNNVLKMNLLPNQAFKKANCPLQLEPQDIVSTKWSTDKAISQSEQFCEYHVISGKGYIKDNFSKYFYLQTIHSQKFGCALNKMKKVTGFKSLRLKC